MRSIVVACMHGWNAVVVVEMEGVGVDGYRLQHIVLVDVLQHFVGRQIHAVLCFHRDRWFTLLYPHK